MEQQVALQVLMAGQVMPEVVLAEAMVQPVLVVKVEVLPITLTPLAVAVAEVAVGVAVQDSVQLALQVIMVVQVLKVVEPQVVQVAVLELRELRVQHMVMLIFLVPLVMEEQVVFSWGLVPVAVLVQVAAVEVMLIQVVLLVVVAMAKSGVPEVQVVELFSCMLPPPLPIMVRFRPVERQEMALAEQLFLVDKEVALLLPVGVVEVRQVGLAAAVQVVLSGYQPTQ